MLVLQPISAGQARYYLEGPAPGQWIATGRHDLDLRGPVDGATLHALLSGVRPDGAPLLTRHSARRRSGFDLILAAPKSVSLLAALADDPGRAAFLRAHERAVEETIGYLERNATWTRRGADHTRIPTTGLVAAAFQHSTSAAGDPHLHTHVVVANVVRGDDGRWSTLDSRSLYRHSRAAGAVFQSALRHHLAEQGLRFEWTVNGHGLGDIVGVSRAAIDAASLRHQQVINDRDPGLAGRVERATAAGRTRRTPIPGLTAGAAPSPGAGTSNGPDAGVGPGPASPGTSSSPGAAGGGIGPGAGNGTDAPWRRRVAAVGLDREGAARLIAGAAGRARLGTETRPVDGMSLEHLLSQQYSRFGRPDVVRAAATLSARGASAASLEAVADRFLETALPAGGETWTTAGLRRLEQQMVAAAQPGRPAVGLTAPGQPPPVGLDDAGRRAVERLTRGGAAVDLLRGDLMGQAQVLNEARQAWEAGGHRVAMVSPTERGQARWRTLAGLEPAPATGHPTVVLVDHADRWSTAELHRVMADASARQAKVVLLDGGTLSRRRQPVSPAMETLRTSLVTINAGPAGPRGHRQSPAPPTKRAPTPVVAAGRDGTVILAPTAGAAMDHLVEDWHRQRVANGPLDRQPRMVALGPDEAEHLNALARSVRVQAGELGGPTVAIGGRPFQVHDEVAALRKDSRLGAVPGGTVGRVTAVDPERGRATIQWSGRHDAHAVGDAAGVPLTHSYATTPSYLRRGHAGPVLSLGHVEALAPRLHPDRVYEVVPLPPVTPGRDYGNPIAHLVAELPVRTGTGTSTGTDGTGDAARTLAELAVERDRLAERLLATAPPDVRPQQRRLTEERAWLAASPHVPGREATRQAIDARWAVLAAAAHDRGNWLETHRDQLERYDVLSNAMAWRTTALGRGAEIRPSVAVAAELGAFPPESARQPAWRRAAQAIEAHRDRWGLPDRPLEPGPVAGLEHDLARRADELRVLTSARQLQRTPTRDHGLAPGGL